MQSRDEGVLFTLFDSRVSTLSHLAQIHFAGRLEAAKKRIQKLKALGLIGARKRQMCEPAILYLTRVGFNLLQGQGKLADLPRFTWQQLERRLQVSELTLRHELEVMDVKTAIHSAIAKAPRFGIREFSTWPLLFQFEAAPDTGPDVLVKPDGFLRIHETEGNGVFEHCFFLEVDRSTETLETLASRALCYLNFYQRGGLAIRFGAAASDYKDYPFRVLMVFKTAERRNNFAERLLTGRPPILTQVWLSTIEEVKANSLGPIWMRPREYRGVVEGTPYAIDRVTHSNMYRRQSEREEIVESRVAKHRLLAPAGEGRKNENP